MKKLLILFATIMFAVSASFAQNPPTVLVTWDTASCDCQTSAATDYFKVTISVYDNANSEWVITNKTRETVDTTDPFLVIDVPEMLTYCQKTHDYTPAFTVSATVWLIETTPDPDVECCTGSDSSTGDCRDFEAGEEFEVPEIALN